MKEKLILLASPYHNRFTSELFKSMEMFQIIALLHPDDREDYRNGKIKVK